jgi:hypothetical protein
MKIACISTTKNECDVIEAFVRHNARFCDKFIFVDESLDATRSILGQLQIEGFDISVFNSTTVIYEQRGLINSALRYLDEQDDCDWAFFLDADEILPDISRDEMENWLRQVPAETMAAMAWQTYVPLSRNFYSFNDPITENFVPRSSEGQQSPIHKISIPKSLFGLANIDPGNHGASHLETGARIPAVSLPLRLAHFPVRSIEQITVKNIVAAHVTSMKESKTEAEGWHVYKSLEQMRSNDFAVTYEELLNVALTYAIENRENELPNISQGASIRANPMLMKYANLRYRNPLAALDRELENMSRMILNYRKTITETRRSFAEVMDKFNLTALHLGGVDKKNP